MLKIPQNTFLMLLGGLAVFVLPNLLIYKEQVNPWWVFVACIVGLILCLFLHELIHALAFLTVGRANRKDVSFGGGLSQGMLYCTCTKLLPRNAYLWAVIAPTLINVLAGIAVALTVKHYPVAIGLALLLSGSCGDLAIFAKVRKLPPYTLVLDHPKVPGFYAVYDERELPEDFVEADELAEKTALNQLAKYKDTNKKAGLAQAVVWIALIVTLAISAIVLVLLTK